MSYQAFNKGLVLPQQDAVTCILKTDDILGNCHFFRDNFVTCASPCLIFAFTKLARVLFAFFCCKNSVKTYLPTKFISVQVVLVHGREITIFPADVRKL